ncbi:hypothetical protein QTO34_007644 [Cnephaeus nilssonii]|uniref:Uncharacterized protein n=1 Tax=Cnephaeus nilssonii TaxID=3371016 RepID=A0AA40LH16_CNENI|nr:hypothetical protein QTO34_007644 [Eptesicus nilssonii]
MIKQKQRVEAGKGEVPLPNVHAQGKTEVLKVTRAETITRTRKRKKNAWKKMVTEVLCWRRLTQNPPKYGRCIRPMGLRFKKAHVTHPEPKATFCLPILSVKKNPSSPLYTTLGVITKGTVNKVYRSKRRGGAGLGVAKVADWAGWTLSSRRQWRLELSVCAMAVLRHRRGLWGSELTSHRGPSKAGELGACPLVHQAFQKPPARRRLLKGLVHQRTGTQLPRDQKQKHQAFQKPPPRWRLLKGLVHQRTDTQLPCDRKQKRVGDPTQEDHLCRGRPEEQGVPAPRQTPSPGSQSWEKKSLWAVRTTGCEKQCGLGLSDTEAAGDPAAPLKKPAHKLNFQGSSQLQHQGEALGDTDTYEEELDCLASGMNSGAALSQIIFTGIVVPMLGPLWSKG